MPEVIKFRVGDLVRPSAPTMTVLALSSDGLWAVVEYNGGDPEPWEAALLELDRINDDLALSMLKDAEAKIETLSDTLAALAALRPTRAQVFAAFADRLTMIHLLNVKPSEIRFDEMRTIIADALSSAGLLREDGAPPPTPTPPTLFTHLEACQMAEGVFRRWRVKVRAPGFAHDEGLTFLKMLHEAFTFFDEPARVPPPTREGEP